MTVASRISLALLLAAATSLVAVRAQVAPATGVRGLEVRPNVHMIAGAGGNITVQIGKHGVLLVDTPQPATAAQAIAEIRKLSKAPIRYVINTSADPDHAGGNDSVAATGVPAAGGVFGGPPVVVAIGQVQGMAILAHENVLNRMTRAPGTGEPSRSQAGLPTSSYYLPTKDFSFNGEAIVVHHQPAAHTDGDSIVFFRSSDVISTGDVFTPDRFPMIDTARGGGVEGVIAGLNLVLSLTVPEAFQEGGTKVIPGHGRLSEENDVVEYRDMVWIVRDRIADSLKSGMTLAQIKAARPTSDYDAEYGSAAVSADAFVEAIHASLTKKK